MNPLRTVALGLRAARVVATVVVFLVPALLAGVAEAAVRGRAVAWRRADRRIVALVMALGPAFVKAGQVLGTRRDVLPGHLCDALSALQDSVTPLSAPRARRALREAYGADLDVLFTSVDLVPVASGSVACVHRARLRSGREVALKLRRPGIDRVMRHDLELIRRGAALAACLPVFRGVPVTEVVGHMCDAVLGQLDFKREAESLVRLRENLSSVPRVWVPLVIGEACRPECIVMEFVPGLDVETPGRCTTAARKRFAASGLTAIYQMLFVDGFVHCDMHPGNLYFTERAQVVVLDAGFSVRLSERLRRLFADFFLNMAIGDGPKCAAIVVESSANVGPDADVDGFLERMAALVHHSHGLSAKEFSLMAFATEMFDLQRGHGIHAAPELIFPLLSLLVIEGTIRELDPDVDFQEVARPVLMRGRFGVR
ncbi:AarF/UbiB family protein [Lentzea sp. BCCO 10_0856]|uniref:AarF/UbiB family protein n=1 Tax=Lentzea miocenica TaxID=3095431 RepID=A0ABU4T875_9PSEU|nr:AarF/UbiB family protein [Lentzea sp. BCCO 10_0856]MDX8034133.1 AarF/UbiB family protein [Lentzea sp. BCCO 10_0856]